MKRISIQYYKYLALPAFLLFGFFFLFPLSQGIWMSLTNWDGFSKPRFVGFNNFIQFFSDSRALGDVKTTILFALCSAPLLNLFGLGFALLLDKKYLYRNLVRTLVYLPAIISPMIMGSIWYLLLQPSRGLLATIFINLALNISGNWMADGYALLVIILVNVWQFSGMTMVIYLAGLQSIPQELYEAADIDGASSIKSFKYITLPMLLPALRINIITNIIGSLSVFEVILALTDGGPGYSTESLSIYIMRMVYGNKTGYSTAVAIILFFIVLIPVIISMRFFNTIEEKQQ